MVRATLIACLLVALTVGSPSHATPAIEVGNDAMPLSPAQAAGAISEAHARVRNRDTQGAVNILRPIVGTPAFAALSDDQRYWGHYLLGVSLYELEEPAEALPHLRAATGFSNARGHDWWVRFWAAAVAEQDAEAIECLTTMAERWPTSLSRVPDRAVSHLVRRARSVPEGEARERQLLLALYTGGWRSDEPFGDPGFRWQTLARLLLAAGDDAQARLVARDIVGTRPIINMLIDRRYDPLIDDARRNIDLRAALEHDLTVVRSLAVQHPNRLDGQLQIATDLLALGQAEEALQVLDAALVRAASPRADGARFENQDEWLNWAHDYRALALFELGRTDDAIASLRRAARQPESGGVNVSQTINLAEMLLRAGRPQEALAQLVDLDQEDLSPYGWMNANYVRACASHELGDSAQANLIAASMRARASDSRRVMRFMELCVGDQARAAEIYIAALEDPLDRGRALWDAQRFERPVLTPFGERMVAAFDRMIERPDVRDAIDRHGRMIVVPLRNTGL